MTSASDSPIRAHGGVNVCTAHRFNAFIMPCFNFMTSDDNIYGVDDDCTEFMILQDQKNHVYWNIEPPSTAQVLLFFKWEKLF